MWSKRVQNLPNSYQSLTERSLNRNDWSQLRALLEPKRWERLTDPQRLQQTLMWKERLYWHHHTRIATWFPTPGVRLLYPKQMQHFQKGAKFDERALFGGNRTGKTHCGTFEDTLHLTGLYPDWWDGRRFDTPIGAWTATDTAKNV